MTDYYYINFYYCNYFSNIRRNKIQFEVFIRNIDRRYNETSSDFIRETLEKYMAEHHCPTCQGYRLKEEALCVLINKRHISQVTELSITDAYHFFKQLQLTDKEEQIARLILKEINDRLEFLMNVGLDYLTMALASGTLSGGEAQRIRLATQIGSALTGVLYVLEVPSIGFNQMDNDRLIIKM